MRCSSAVSHASRDLQATMSKQNGLANETTSQRDGCRSKKVSDDPLGSDVDSRGLVGAILDAM